MIEITHALNHYLATRIYRNEKNQALIDPHTCTQAMHLKLFQWTTHPKSNLLNKFHNFFRAIEQPVIIKLA